MIRRRVFFWDFTIIGFTRGRRSFPMWDFIRFVRWRRILSELWKPSISRPIMFLLSSRPTRRFPPDVFRNAAIVFSIPFSIFLSCCFV